MEDELFADILFEFSRAVFYGGDGFRLLAKHGRILQNLLLTVFLLVWLHDLLF